MKPQCKTPAGMNQTGVSITLEELVVLTILNDFRVKNFTVNNFCIYLQNYSSIL